MTTRYQLIKDTSGAHSNEVTPSDSILNIRVHNNTEYFDVPSQKATYILVFEYKSNTSDSLANKVNIDVRNYPYPPSPLGIQNNPKAFSTAGGSRVFLSPARPGIDLDVLVSVSIYESSDRPAEYSVQATESIEAVYIIAKSGIFGMGVGVIGQYVEYEAYSFSTSGIITLITDSCDWTSSNSAIAVCNNEDGRYLCLTEGTIDVQARYQGFQSNYLPLQSLSVISLSITPVASSIGILETQQYSASIYLSNEMGYGLAPTIGDWSSSNINIATITSMGVATGVEIGTANIDFIFLTYHSNTAELIVEEIDRVVIYPIDPTIHPGGTITFSAVAYSTEGIGNYVKADTWNSSDHDVATIDSETGIATGITLGSTNIWCTYGGINSNVEVLDVEDIDHITIIPTNPSVDVGETMQFTAIAYYTDNTSATITPSWTSSQTSRATIDAAGIATGVASGTTSIGCTYLGHTASPQILTVVDISTDISHIYVIVSSPKNPWTIHCASTGVTQGLKCKAYAAHIDGSQVDITAVATWYSNAPSIISNATAPGDFWGHSQGQTTLYVTYNGFRSDNISVTVDEIPNTTLSPVNPTISIGGMVNFIAYLYPTRGDNWYPMPQHGTWTSSNTAVATVDLYGTVTGVASGTSTISVTMPNVSKTLSQTVTVNNTVYITGIHIIPDSANQWTYNPNSLYFKCYANWNNLAITDITTEASVSWLCANTKFVSNGNGQFTPASATHGPSQVYATYGGFHSNYLAAFSQLEENITLSPVNPTIPVGGKVNFLPLVYTHSYSDVHDNLNPNHIPHATWSSSNTSVATVDAYGVVTGIAIGTSTITATITSYYSSTRAQLVTVTESPGMPASLTVLPNTNPVVNVSQTTQFMCFATDSLGNSNYVIPTQWYCTDSEVLLFQDAYGSAVGVANGVVQVRARVGTLYSPWVTVYVNSTSYVTGDYAFSEESSKAGFLPCAGTGTVNDYGFTFCRTNPLYTNLYNWLCAKNTSDNTIPKYGFGDGATAGEYIGYTDRLKFYNIYTGTPAGTTSFEGTLTGISWIVTNNGDGVGNIQVGTGANIAAASKPYLHYFTKQLDFYLVFSIDGALPEFNSAIPTGTQNYGVISVNSTDTNAQVVTAFIATINNLTAATPDIRGHFIRITSNGSGWDYNAATRTDYQGNVTGTTYPIGDKPGTWESDSNKPHNHELDHLGLAGETGDTGTILCPKITHRSTSTVIAEDAQSGMNTYISESTEDESRPINFTLNAFIKY